MQLCETGKSFGVTVVQENVVRCESASLGFLSKMQSILGKELRLCLDIKQAVRSKENPMTAAERLGANIDLVHISDHGEYGDCLQIGKGRFNIKAFLSKIGEKNPDAKIILELYRSSFDSASDLYTNYSRLSSYIQGLAC
jgi:sugar phosphate isomerase/epimerase